MITEYSRLLTHRARTLQPVQHCYTIFTQWKIVYIDFQCISYALDLNTYSIWHSTRILIVLFHQNEIRTPNLSVSHSSLFSFSVQRSIKPTQISLALLQNQQNSNVSTSACIDLDHVYRIFTIYFTLLTRSNAFNSFTCSIYFEENKICTSSNVQLLLTVQFIRFFFLNFLH